MNLLFTCGPSGFTVSFSSLRRKQWFWAWANRLIAAHQEKCPYCKFEKDPNTGREIGQ